jgi:hypothetical protein
VVKSSIILAVVIVIILAFSAGYYIISVSSSGGSGGATINLFVSDGTPQNGAPDQIEPIAFNLTEGKTATIVFDNTDDGPHGIAIPGLNFNTGVIQGGQTQRFTITPTQTGTFPFFQPAGYCVDDANPEASCTGAQNFNGTVTVLP